jgi:succinate dehydrogenase / fumarate reductase, cytochrome b subunit
MSDFSKALSASLGRKFLMAATGLFLCIFLVEHLYTNLMLYAEFFTPGDKGAAFNEASHSMVHNLIIRIVEVVLFLAIIVHVIDALMLTAENKKARPVGYAVSKVNETSTWFSRNMGLTGSFILFFIIVHLYNFFLPYRIQGTEHTPAMIVRDVFHSPAYVVLYSISLILLGFHLNHGFQSSFQSLGFNNRKYAGTLRTAGTIFALIITIGFLTFPILFFFDIAGTTF